MKQMEEFRREENCFGETAGISTWDTGNSSVFAIRRTAGREELICLAHELFSTKGDDGFIPSIQYVADLLADEAGRYFHYHLPSNVLENRDVWLTTILVSRDHLPDNTLKPEIVYPMLILPDDGPDAMILPYWYWQK